MKKTLDAKEPLLNGYMEDAYALAVALSKDSSLEWVFSNYIQLVFQDPYLYDNQPLKFFKLSFKNGMVWDAECPLLNYDTITRKMLNEMDVDIIDYIRDSILHGLFVKVYLDEYYLPYRFSYKKKHYTHESLFYGFDDDKEELYGLAYVTDRNGYHFKRFIVEMKIIREAYYSPIEEGFLRERIVGITCNSERYYEFDKNVVKKSIYEYIHSIRSDVKYSEINNPDKSIVFGIKTYEHVRNYYQKMQDLKMSPIPLHIIFEHKKLMYERVKYMMKNRYIRYNRGLLDGFIEIINKAIKCKYMFLKCSSRNSEYAHKKLDDEIQEIRSLDELLMKKLYLMLSVKKEFKQNSHIYSRWGWWKDIALPVFPKVTVFLDVSFKLHIINELSCGYIRVTSDKCLKNYIAPFVFRIDTIRRMFGVADYRDENYEALKKINCDCGETYIVRFEVDMKMRTYSLTITRDDMQEKYNNVFSEDVSKYLDYINSIVIVHENAYRFAISDLLISEIK